MLRYLIGPALAAGAFAAPAFAQEEAPLSAPAPEAKAFTGPRVEALAGYDESFIYGGAVGYDYQVGHLVFGAEAELSESTGKECFTNAFALGDRFCQIQGRSLSVGGRIGVAVAPTTLLYGKIGYTNQRTTVDYTAGSPPAFASFRVSSKLDGIRVGAGLEQKIGRNAYIKGEYRYSDYENGDRKHDGVIGFGFRF